ncbi:hypothetical protein HanIR_Chr17g0845761 [Helianthus annuus]|nr:hypothetical protein HanIR_Chr17g0845761 [Helianthus annuus]
MEDTTERSWLAYLIGNSIQDSNYTRKTTADSNTDKTSKRNAENNKKYIKCQEYNRKPAL